MDADYSLIPPHLAVDSMRDSGYKNAAHAIAELMDNSIQAEADTVELLCIEHQVHMGQYSTWQIERVGISDNGNGMDANTLRIALQFGNGTHLHDSSGIGRFGMGLPNASISQCRHVDVWSWQHGPDSALYTYIDLDEVVNRKYREVPAPVAKPVPEEWRKCISALGNSGTLVVWSKLDRIMWKTAKSLIRHSEHLIGRMYRYFLHDGRVRIRLTHFPDDQLGTPGEYEKWAKPNDPSYLLTPSSTPAPYDNQAMFEQYGEPIEKSVQFRGATHTVRIEFSYARKEARQVYNSVDPGKQPHGRHAKHNIGVSLVREERELMLDATWANEQPTERWWAVTVHIPRSLDEVFGVTNNKQAALAFTEAAHPDHADLGDSESLTERIDELRKQHDPLAILLEVARDVRKTIADMRGYLERQTKGQRKNRMHQEHGDPAAERATNATQRRKEEGHKGRSDPDEERPATERQQLLTKDYEEAGVSHGDAEQLAARVIDSGLKYSFLESPLQSPAFFTVRPSAGTIQVRINTEHPAYRYLFELLEEDSIETEEDITALREKLVNAYNGLKLLLMAWARYEDEQEGASRQYAQEVRSYWGMMANRFFSDE